MTPPTQVRRRWRSCRTIISIPLFLFLTVLVAFWMIMGESSAPELPAASSYLEYSTVAGFFLQDEPSTDPDAFDYTQNDFGLIGQAYDTDISHPTSFTPWQRFERKLDNLNKEAPKGTTYRLLLLGRHGQGYHNVAETFYGTVAWDCYYSTLNGTANITWADAHLTTLGISQAKAVNSFWRSQIKSQHMPTPQTFYTSPLDRAIHTTNVTFADLSLPPSRPFKATIKELMREANGIHTCDRRSTRSAIAARWPKYAFDDGFAEEDPLWLPDLRESDSALMVRLRTMLDDVFEHDKSTWISMTAHGGMIQGILSVIGHRKFYLPTGGAIPVLVKTVRVQGRRGKDVVEPWQPKPECKDRNMGVGDEGDLQRLEEYLKDTV